MEANSHEICGCARHGGDLGRSKPLPGGECEDLAVSLAEQGKCTENKLLTIVGDGYALLLRRAELVGKPPNEHVGRMLAAGALQKQVARHAEQPEARLLSRRDVLEPAPGDEVRVGQEIGRFLGIPCATDEVAKEIGSRAPEEILELRASLAV
jgi:hypothetical protein